MDPWHQTRYGSEVVQSPDTHPPTFNIRISEARLKLRVLTDIAESHMYVHAVVIIYTVSDTIL